MKLSKVDVENLIKTLLRKYRAEYAILFGSYARGDADEDSDIDVIVVGGEKVPEAGFCRKASVFKRMAQKV